MAAFGLNSVAAFNAMHQALLIQEILFNIFAHCPSLEQHFYLNANLAVLARTCRTFKEPALDLIWEELRGLAPLARCLPEACCASDSKCYSFSRQLNESEWNTLRGYARRVRRMNFLSSNHSLDPSATRVIFTLAPFTDPLFPNLRSLFWKDPTILPTVHTIIPSLTTLHLDFASFSEGKPPPIEFLGVVGERCRYMNRFSISWSPFGLLDAAVSCQVCRWTNLRFLACTGVALSTDAVLHLASLSTLSYLSFPLSVDLPSRLSHFDSIIVFSPNLATLQINSTSLKTVTQFLSHICLPGITNLDVIFTNDAWKQDVRAYWAAVVQACPSNTLFSLALICDSNEGQDPAALEEQMHLQLTLDDLPFYQTFTDLDAISIELPWSVKLTDVDLLNLVYKSPDLSTLSINADWGWRPNDGGGITLDGLLQLLRYCLSLRLVELAIDTQTFTAIPQGPDVSFLPDTIINVLDSRISPDLVPGLASAFRALELDPSSFDAAIYRTRGPGEAQRADFLWGSMRRAMWELS